MIMECMKPVQNFYKDFADLNPLNNAFFLSNMAKSLTVLGNLSWGWRNPSLSLYSGRGLKWSAQELKEVKALHSENRDHLPGSFCNFCEQLHELQQFEKFIHQPGYRALSRSASKFPICSLFRST
jgi:hypothetical protein